MAQELDNPYIVGIPINDDKKFFGREDLFEFIRDNLLQGASVILLHGQRRIGKSSLLVQIPKADFLRDLTQFIFIPLSLEGQSQGSLADILYHLARGIVRYLKSYLKLSADDLKIPDKQTLESNPKIFSIDFFEQIYQVLGEDRKPVLLLDEFDVIIDVSDQKTTNVGEQDKTKDFFRHLQSLIVYPQPARFCLIPFAGRRADDMQTLVSLFREAPRREVGLLDKTHTTNLITKPAEDILEYDAKAVEIIWQLTSGHPFCTQALCSALFEKAREKYREELADWNKISEEDVKKSIDAGIETAYNGLDWFYSGIPIAERVVFSAIAETQERSYPDHWQLLANQGVILTDELEQALDNLKTGGFIQERNWNELSRDRPYPYAIVVDFVRRWFIKRHSLRQEILKLDNQLDKQHPEIKDLYAKAKDFHEQGEIPQAIELYEQILQINPNHFSSLFAIASACLEDEQYSKAVDFYTRICKIDHLSVLYREELVKSLVGYGRDLIQAGNLTQAQIQFSTVLALDPENKRSQQQLVKIEAQLQKEQQQISERLQTLRNPFFVGAPVPPDRFIGRNSIIQTAFDQIYNRSHLAIWGNTGTGKSSLLQFIASSQVWLQNGLDSSLAIIVNLNCTDINPFTPSAFWTQILSLLKDKLYTEPELQEQVNTLLIQGQASQDSLRKILRELGRRRKFMLLLIDDYDIALAVNQEYSEEDMEKFLGEFRSLAVHSDERKNLSTVVTSTKRLNDLRPSLNPNQSPWYNHYWFRQIKLFDIGEISTLLEHFPDELQLSEGLMQIIQEISGGYPVLLQIACSLIYNSWRSGENLTIENYTKEFLKTTEHIFQDWWLTCTEREQMLLFLIALSRLENRFKQRRYKLSDVDIILVQNQRTLINLEEMGLIARAAEYETNNYKFVSAMMEFWILREIERNDEEKFQQKYQTALKLMTHKQAEQLQFIIRGLVQSKDGSKSVIDWLTILVGNVNFSLRVR